MQGAKPISTLKQRWTTILLLLVLALPALVWLRISGHAVLYFGDSTAPESSIAHGALLAAQDGHLYRSYQAHPFTPTPFGPLYHGLLALIAKAGSFDLYHELVAGRILTLLGWLGVLAMIYRISRNIGLFTLHAALAVMWFAALHEVTPWNATTRPDFLALFFTLLGFSLLTKGKGEYDTPLHIVAAGGVCFGVSLMLKQAFLVAPAVVGLAFLVQKKFKSAFVLAAVAGTVMAASMFYPWLRHESLAANMFAPGMGAVDMESTLAYFDRAAVLQGIRLPLLVLAVIGLYFVRKEGRARRLQEYFLLAWFLGIVVYIRNLGSDTNVFLEGWVLASILAAYAFNRFTTMNKTVLPIAVSVIVLVFCFEPGYGIGYVYTMKMNELRPVSAVQQITSRYRILTDETFLEATSVDPVLLDPFFVHNLERNGNWDPKPFTAMLQRQEFDMVVFTVEGLYIRRYRGMNIMSTPILDAVHENYVLVCRMPKVEGFSKFMFLAPKQRPFDTALMESLRKLGCK